MAENDRKEQAPKLDATDATISKPAKKASKSQPTLATIFRVLTYGTKLDVFLMLVSMLTSIGAGITMPLMNIVLGALVSDFTGYFLPNTTVTKQQFQKTVNKNALMIFGLFIARFFLAYISLISIRFSGMRISAAFRLAYLRATFAQPVAKIDTISPGIVSTRITTSANTVQLAISQQFALFFQALALIIGLFVVSFVKSWLLTFVASASMPLIIISYMLLFTPFIKIQKSTAALNDDATALAYEIISSIRIVTAFGAAGKLSKQHEELLEKAAKMDRRAAPLLGMMMSPSFVAMYGTFGITFWFGIRQFSRGELDDVGVIIVVLFSVMMAMLHVGRVAGPLINMGRASTAAAELFEIIDAEVPETTGLKGPDVTAEANLCFENVAFSYPSRPNVQILNGLDVTFEVGKTTAIVGPSGSGKSTVVALIQRWYDLLGTTARFTTMDKTEDTVKVVEQNTEAVKTNKDGEQEKEKEEEDKGPHTCTGTVRVGNTNLRDIDVKWWRSQIGLVQQEPFLFNDTLFENVTYGLCGTPLADLSKDQKMQLVEEACREACAEEFISRLPSGYETMVGEGGIKLSGGQRQRIAIARSIIKNPSILILDEATSAIDVRTERIVQEALDRVSKNRTTIVIAHRLSTIKRADKIVVLRQGKLVEEGTHDELLQIEGGVYYGLVHAQDLSLEADVSEKDEEAGLKKVKLSTSVKSTTSSQRQDHVVTEDSAYKEQGLVKSFGRLLAEQKRNWILYALGIFAICIAGAVYPIQAYIFANIIDVFTLVNDMAKMVTEGNFWAGMFGVEAAAVGLAYFVLFYCSHLIANAITRFYRQEYLENMLKKRISFFDQQGHSAGSLTSRLSNDPVKLQQLMSTEMSMALIAIVNLVGSTIIAFVYGWKLTIVGLFCAMPPILLAGYYRVRIEVGFEKMNEAVFKDSSQFATETVGAYRTVTSLLMEDTITGRYSDLLAGHVKKAFDEAKYGTIIFAASDSIDLACIALAFWYGGTLLASREYTVMDFFVIYMAVIQGAMAAGMWFSFAPNMATATVAANSILSMRAPKTDATSRYDDFPSAKGGVGIDFQHVGFTYKGRDVPVLSDLNLQINPGQFAALVGASGCGKSTSISLLERFYDATSGYILYNGQDITKLDPEVYRKQVSLVSQEPTLYEGTIRDNVALSMDSATDEEIHQACIDAQIHEFIISLPEGYNTRLGTKGMSLSGGQKQRLALARALLRKPKLLLLDEATSSLDSESEKLVQAAIERAAGEGNRTIIAVAHRLATIQKADVIFVLGSGTVLEHGDHATLLRKKGLYYQMCQAQALDR